jgi:tetratricopeptide (TPR) repeat protein
MKNLIVLLLMVAPFIGSCSHPEKKDDQPVFKAFDLRMQGKADQAIVLLDSIIMADSVNAMAYYELSRAKHYMLLGGGSVSIEDILAAVEKATQYDSGNVIYAYAKAMDLFLNAYMAMHREPEKVKERVAASCAQFERALKLKPAYPQAMLYLVEIYGLLPADMGGDSLKAVTYAGQLNLLDPFFGAKATLDLAPEETDPVAFWKEYQTLHGETPDVLQELGIACFYKDDPETAAEYFTKAIEMDSSRQILLLDLARYYMMGVMQNKDLADSLLPISASYINRYLESNPAPPVPMKAYALGMLVKTKMFTGHKEEAEKLMEEAKSLDPYFSRAFGIPSRSLFDPPDVINNHYFSFFRPF